jgi:folylpolyglutamate synthase/dihydropteroate synthase
LLAAIRQRQAGRRMALVVNSCRDKGLESMFSQYLEVFKSESIYIVPIASTARACTPHEYCARVGLAETQASLTLADGIRRAAENVGRQGVIYISGSLYLLGEALTYLEETQALESILI